MVVAAFSAPARTQGRAHHLQIALSCPALQ